jgi:hypothetical protein
MQTNPSRVISALAILSFAITCHAASDFEVKLADNAITNLKRREGGTEYIQSGRKLGDVFLRFRTDGKDWKGTTNAALKVESNFAVQEKALVWRILIQNQSNEAIEIGDLALPLPISRGGRRGGNFDSDARDAVILKHQFVSGHGSFLFWMRSDLTGPHLVLLPTTDTSLEYWEGSRDAGYRLFIHSAATGAELKANGRTWRQPHTSLKLAPKGKRGDTKSYELKFRWAEDYDSIRQLLVDEGGVDVRVAPGMTIPNDLFAQVALRSKEIIQSVEAEFPKATEIKSLGKRGDYRLYEIRFSKLGENRLTVRYGNGRHVFLEFFCTEPLETLIKKRAAFIARSQHRDPTKWYNGLITDWNMAAQKLISPDDYAPIPRARYYAVTCDDPGLGKPAFLAAKNAEFPVQSEVEALDYYIKHFVWGGLQRTTEEKYPYAIYGIPDWKTNRESSDAGRNGQLHIWREYDYPHVIQMYFAMYRLAKNHPEIKTALSAKEYLQRAYGTANAFFVVPNEVWSGWSPYGTGFYNELVIVDLIDELDRAGMKTEADTLRAFWERKVRNFVNRRQDLFRSEYAFDTTGFESTHALAKYGIQYAASDEKTNAGVTLPDVERFLEKQMAANLFCRGVLEPAYYYLGSDIRGSGGNAYTLTYMSQMGGWSVLDYALNFATNRAPYLRLGYASYLSAWALVNSGTPESDYGYWFPGKANDGAAGGGFEPSANGRMWLVPSNVLGRGSWSFACEIDLGYCGALRSAATILADDPIFGRFCFGGEWRKSRRGIEVIPKDGLRRRFHAMLDDSQLHLLLDNDRFAKAQPIVFDTKLSKLEFQIESDNRAKHEATLNLSGLRSGAYELRNAGRVIQNFDLREVQECPLRIPIEPGTPSSFTIQRNSTSPTK